MWRAFRQALWSLDALLLVLGYTALLLLIPTRSPKWHEPS
jgi:hypothetical protein